MKTYNKDYPRPQLVRNSWINLNGSWKFQFDDANKGETKGWQSRFPEETLTIQVPFTYETKASGIGDEAFHNQIWYERTFQIEASELYGKRMMLHFEGSDYYTKVWVNGKAAGTHKGGYARFSFDITELVNVGENIITVKVEDSKDTRQPRGKQRWEKENFGCWYVQTTGIWKTVWLEVLPLTYLKQLKMTPQLNEQSVDITYELFTEKDYHDLSVEVEISFEGRLITKMSAIPRAGLNMMRINVTDTEEFEWGIYSWSCEYPSLYDVRIHVMENEKLEDEVLSYFGMRDIRIENGNILLNGAPIYQRLILDQGYWVDSHLTPPSEDALIEDIDKILAMGFNGLRKHMKTEDERFLYWCDVKGVLVWGEMAAPYQFSDDEVQGFTEEWMDVVRQNYNHPSIITWTPFNESWGIGQVKTDATQQHFTESIYHLTKSFDAYRPVIVNDGWEHTVSDIITLHDYEEDGERFFERYLRFDDIMSDKLYHCGNRSAFANGFSYKGQPVIISEYGGIAFATEKDGWGYGNMVKDEEAFLNRFGKMTDAIKKIPYVVGYCYTQVSDVQQEKNGLLDAHRNYKIEPEKIRKINERKYPEW